MLSRRKFLAGISSTAICGLCTGKAFSSIEHQGEKATVVISLKGLTHAASSFFPDGRRLVSICSAFGGNSDFRMIQADVNAEGGIRTFPVFPDVVRVYGVAVSPDAESVAICVRLIQPAAKAPYKSLIYIVGADSGELRQEIVLSEEQTTLNKSGVPFGVGWADSSTVITFHRGQPKLYSIALDAPVPVAFCDLSELEWEEEGHGELVYSTWREVVLQSDGKIAASLERCFRRHAADRQGSGLYNHPEVVSFDLNRNVSDRFEFGSIPSEFSRFRLANGVCFLNRSDGNPAGEKSVREFRELASDRVVDDVSDHLLSAGGRAIMGAFVAISPGAERLAILRALTSDADAAADKVRRSELKHTAELLVVERKLLKE